MERKAAMLVTPADIRAMASRLGEFVDSEDQALELAQAVADEIERAAAPLRNRVERLEMDLARAITAGLIRKHQN